MTTQSNGGLHYALDATSSLIRCVPGLTGDYFCQFCHCKMHCTHRNDNYYFACNPGEVHDPHKPCYEMVANKVDYDPDKKSPKDFIESLIIIPGPERGPRGSKGSGESTPSTIELDDGPIAKSVTSLSDLIKTGIQYMNPSSKFYDCEFLVSDLVMHFRWADSFFCNSKFDLGYRVIFVNYDFYDESKQILQFSLFKKNLYTVRFNLCFSEYETYVKYRDLFTEFVECGGKSKRVRKTNCKTAVIAGNWVKIPKPSCMKCLAAWINKDFCNKCLGLYKTTFTNPKQLKLINDNNSDF